MKSTLLLASAAISGLALAATRVRPALSGGLADGNATLPAFMGAIQQAQAWTCQEKRRDWTVDSAAFVTATAAIIMTIMGIWPGYGYGYPAYGYGCPVHGLGFPYLSFGFGSFGGHHGHHHRRHHW
jgi:hypothetical protein